MSAIEIELHRKLGGKPSPPGMKLEQVLSDNLVDLLVSGGEGRWWSVEAILKRGQPVHVKAQPGEPAGKMTLPTSLVSLSG